MNKYCCDGNHAPHIEAIRKAELAAVTTEESQRLSLIFKLFSDPTRLRIISVLAEGELCVCDIADALEYSQSAVSHQLRLLKDGRLVKSRREGRMIYYTLDDDHIYTIMESGLAHVREDD